MSKIIVNAPIQNREFSLNDKPGKVIPLFVADWARTHLPEYESDPGYELWNNVFADIETAWWNDDLQRGHMAERLQRKYGAAILNQRTNAPDTVLTDDMASFEDWAGEVIQTALEQGDATVSEEEVVICSQCGGPRCLAETLGTTSTYDCGECEWSGIDVIRRPVLSSVIDREAYELSAMATSQAEPDGREVRVLLSKYRLGGVSLSAFGLEGMHLDPKVGIVLLTQYAAQLAGASEVDVVAARSSASHNVTKAFSLTKSQADQLPSLHMVPIAKAPVEQIKHLHSEGILSVQAVQHLLTDVLPPHLLTMRKDMTPATLDRIIFSKKG